MASEMAAISMAKIEINVMAMAIIGNINEKNQLNLNAKSNGSNEERKEEEI
jgi:hypothetical protein